MSRRLLALSVLLTALAGACSDSATDPVVAPVTALMSVLPGAGAVNVTVGTNVVVSFDHAIAPGMERFADLHEGSVAGPVVAGTWTLSQDRATLTFVPASPLKPATAYVIHLAGGMTDATGAMVNLEAHGLGMGGQWATQTMMGGGGMGGGMGGQSGTHMGTGWQHPSNGSYGMVFPFTTAGATGGAAALSGVQPAPGSVNVTVGTNVVVTFDHAVAAGMAAYVDLHEGSLAGPQVAGTWTLSDDRTKLTFVPASPLKPATTYVIHLGGGMMDATGAMVNLEAHGLGMGGQWATQTMMGGGGMGGGMGGQTGTHMGTGWQHPSNGSYGMVFVFTTAAG